MTIELGRDLCLLCGHAQSHPPNRFIIMRPTAGKNQIFQNVRHPKNSNSYIR